MTTLSHSPRVAHDPSLKLASVRRRVASPKPGSGQRLVFSIYETAEQLAETSDMVQSLCRTGVFPNAYKGGRGGKTSPWRIPAQDITAFINARRVQK